VSWEAQTLQANRIVSPDPSWDNANTRGMPSCRHGSRQDDTLIAPRTSTMYEWAIQKAGFRDFAWHPSEVAPYDIARYGEAYWRDFYDNCLIIGVVCAK
jgi:hypothetical protein